MDSLTQIVLGASVGEAALGRKVGNKAILWGAIGGTIPDLDVFVRPFVNDVQAMDLHRGFSHSIVFSVLFAPILGWLIHYFHQRSEPDASWKDWTWLVFLALITHPLLDCHTAYGTQLFWPFEYRIAYQNIFVADPVYTVPFLIFIITVMFYRRNNPKRKRWNNIALWVSSSYMVLTILFKWMVHSQFASALDNKSITYLELDTRPMPLNSILWMGSVETKDSLHIGMYSLLDEDNNIDFLSYPKNHHLLDEVKQNKEVQTLIRLSQGWYIAESQNNELWFHDLRFGQMGFDHGSENFIYSFKIEHKDGKINITQRSRPRGDMGKVFGQLWKRIWTKYPDRQTATP